MIFLQCFARVRQIEKCVNISERPTILKNAHKASAPSTNDVIKPGATIGEALGALNEALKEAKRLKGMSIFWYATDLCCIIFIPYKS